MPQPASTIDTSTTNIAGALSMARTLPVGDSRRIVLISDGAENVGSALDQAVQAASEDTPIDVLAVDGIGSRDLRIDGVSAPEKVWHGESMTVQASVVASEDGSGTVALLVDGEEVATQEVDFRIGLNTYTFIARRSRRRLPSDGGDARSWLRPPTPSTTTTASPLAWWCAMRPISSSSRRKARTTRF